MAEGNIYKPRYNIAFKSNSKVWPYKNSRLRRFFNIRGRKLVRRGLFKRYFLVFNNMKWTIARRYIRPYMKKRRPLRRRYRDIFYTKQQLRAFYGKQKEEAFRNFFKRYLGGAKGRNNTFAAALERRADVFLFRLRFLPTIYASHQYIHHFGININGRKEMSPYALMRPGDIVSFDEKVWAPFVEYLYERLYWRVYGLNVWKTRQFKTLRKKVWWLSKKRFFKKSNAVLMKKFNFILRKILRTNKAFSLFMPQLYKNIDAFEKNLGGAENVKNSVIVELKRDLLFLWNSYKKNVNLLTKNLVKISKKKWRLKLWTWRNYYSQYFMMISSIFRLYKSLKYYFVRVKLVELNFNNLFSEINSKNNLDKNFIYLTLLQKNSTDEIKKINADILFYKNKFTVCLKKKDALTKHLMMLKYKYNFLIWNQIALKRNTSNLFFSVNNNFSSVYFKLILKKVKLLHFIEKETVRLKEQIVNLLNQKKQIMRSLNQEIETVKNEVKSKVNNKKTSEVILKSQIELFEKELHLFQDKLNLLLNFVLKQRIKRFSSKQRLIKDPRTGNEYLQKTSLFYFLAKRRLKKERKLALPRLKKVHWYTPPYIYLDLRTLRAVFLYNPKPEEIMYSFKCSLHRVHSFYRSLGV